MKTGSSLPAGVTPAPPVITRASARTGLLAWGCGGVGLIAALILYQFNPTEHDFYPTCQFHNLTGLLCPGCGSLRALHNLTHGEIATAFHCNPLLVVLLPLFVIIGIHWLTRGRTAFKSDFLLLRPVNVLILLGVTITFGVLRNLPGPAFAWMSP
jgi:hypothetical protein